MAKKRKNDAPAGESVVDYRHKGVTRLNIPPAGIAARGNIVREKQVKFAYNPHLAPALRFDAAGKSDKIADIVDAAPRRVLTKEEAALLKEAFRNHEPWLEWAGKREQQWCVADPVALHIHERISAQAILKVARRMDVERDLFADPEHEYREAVQFYKHPMDWTNRMILGDSLAVMASLARREALAGKVQMIYMDPPYGIKYASNFQPEVGRRDVKDKDEDLTREPEMVKAYRDTWTLGVHSYLSYLRDRLLLCKELLAETGSVFVQINDDNLHRVRVLMDEVFGSGNQCALIAYRTTGGQETRLLGSVCDYLLWYAKDIERVKYRQVFFEKVAEGDVGRYRWIEDTKSGFVRESTDDDVERLSEILREHVLLVHDNITSQGVTKDSSGLMEWNGRSFVTPKNSHWMTTPDGMNRLARANRLMAIGDTLRFKRFLNDFSVSPVDAVWEDTAISGFGRKKQYVVETNAKVIERCMLMTTDPGDLVLDPTCGSGTTAFVAENWGRRWITIDCSRVALAIARQRLLTAKFDYFKLRPTSAADVQRNQDGPWLADPAGQIQGSCTFDCKTVPHVTLKSIAQNPALDPIFEKWEPVLAEKLAALNKALKPVTKELRQKLALKLAAKQKAEGKKAITEADRRRWILPGTQSGMGVPPVKDTAKMAVPPSEWQHWEVPFDSDSDWPKPLQEALTEYRKAWRQKMDEVNACIAARADQEELVDQPVIERGKVRVSGPFTMEGIIPAEESIDDGEEEGSRRGAEAQSPISGAPKDLETFESQSGTGVSPVEHGQDARATIQSEPQNAEAYLDRMIRLLREDGVRFPDNKVMKFTSLEALADGSAIHARGAWANGDKKERLVAVIVGPQYGALNSLIVEEGIGRARRGGYDDLVFAAFSFDGAAQALIQEDPDPKLRIHMAQIRPDVNMGDLLKTTVSSQLFTVSGSPRTRIEKVDTTATARGKRGGDAASTFIVHMEGVDIYDPVGNTVRSTGAEKVAAWFLDSDYDGRCFCVCQAFFPDRSAWEKLGKALGGVVDEDAFARLSGTVSLPFPEGEHKRIAVKVIDPRGNEVLRVHRLGKEYE